MKTQYKKEKGFYKEIEISWDENDNVYVLTKRNVFNKNSQGNCMNFTREEFEILKKMVNAK
jgi:hypothetical protein